MRSRDAEAEAMGEATVRHGTFTVQRAYRAAPARVFAAAEVGGYVAAG